ncbi:twitching motility protein PilT [Hydrogenispora ethanolica]|uniref:Twitching motility protein PilT n=1 Tax=Hydrogenispora ethanolica TaxID=1082276 RepID=A0A4R1RMC5_HYDET|nr:type IV pilus twitching motility protein PilT [Hydrogenispora ethanolica]TCL67423.1 twitching motility protein PilT [Hydrogenispora ethanolica]
MELVDILTIGAREQASDIHLTVGRPPMLRIFGELIPVAGYDILSFATIKELLAPLLNEHRQRLLNQDGHVDFSYGVSELGRFRVNIFRQRGSIAGVMRLIPSDIPHLDMLGLPDAVAGLVEKTRGLVLVTGPTGSGKSTTLASMIDLINQNRSCHIITLEDPIEFLHRHKRSLINQREIGTDADSFAGALRAALREDPDVILVGEMRDYETIQTALTAAETGHLVLATLHTNDAMQTVDRIIDVFPPNQQEQVRTQLSLTLQAIISQQLLPRVDKPGRVLAAEVLVMTNAARNIIREGKTHQLPTVIQTGGRLGMQSMDAALRSLCQRRIISAQEALLRSTDQEEFKKLLGVS